jgi:hypothetical protein
VWEKAVSSEFQVPKGRAILAQRFSAGKRERSQSSPRGTAEFRPLDPPFLKWADKGNLSAIFLLPSLTTILWNAKLIVGFVSANAVALPIGSLTGAEIVL